MARSYRKQAAHHNQEKRTWTPKDEEVIGRGIDRITNEGEKPHIVSQQLAARFGVSDWVMREKVREALKQREQQGVSNG